MEAIDKREEKQANDWQVGDVACFWGDVESKRYTIIIHVSQEDGYRLTNLGVNIGIEEALFVATVSSVVDILTDRDAYVKKVDARLVVEDQLRKL